MYLVPFFVILDGSVLHAVVYHQRRVRKRFIDDAL